MTTREALPLGITDHGKRAAAEHGFTAFNLLDEFGGGIAEADVDATLLLAGRAGEERGGHAANAR